jgi:regulator of sigma E protease
MDFIYNIILQGVSYVIPMVVLLGVLIFIHELGHFAVAKYFNVKVETFSLGFGPKIWKIVRGETTYCVSAIPFGGYVKMYGDDLSGTVPDDMKHRSFLHKPISQRIAIALAGPVMNLILAYFLFWSVSLIGEQVIAPKLGDLSENSEAYKAEFRSGDKILSINDQKITRWEDIEELVSQNPNSDLNFKVLRETHEEPMSLVVTPSLGPSKNIFKLGKDEGQIEGLDFTSDASVIGISDPKSLFGQLGFKTGDQITKINEVRVNTYRSISDVLLNESTGGDKKIIFSVERYGTVSGSKAESIKIIWDLEKNPLPDRAQKLGYEKPETFIGEVGKKTPAEAVGLRVNDQILKINEAPIATFQDIIAAVSSFKEGGSPLKLTIRRDGEIKTLDVTPQITEFKNELSATEKRFTIGVRPLKSTYVEYTSWRAPTFLGSFTWAAAKTWQWTHATVMSFGLLLTNKVSAKNLGGFISIGQMAQKSWQLGIDSFLRIMAIISLNLFVLNLLPIPVLDGGHILLFSIEAIRGAPISLRKLEVAQQIGMFFLLSLLAFSLFNDVSRLFGS